MNKYPTAPPHCWTSQQCHPSASVARLLRALDAEVSLVGVVGADSDGRTLRCLLEDESIVPISVIEDEERRTTCKERFIGRAAKRHAHQILRVDYEQTNGVGEELAERMVAALRQQVPLHDALAISDYNKGTCTSHVLGFAISIAEDHGVPVVIDPARITDIHRYCGASLLTPNRAEAELLTGTKVTTADDAVHAAAAIAEQARLDAALVTLDSDGIAYSTSTNERQHCPTRPRAVYDIIGAGDMVLAITSFCTAVAHRERRSHDRPVAVFSYEEMVTLANIAGGLQVQRIGVSPVSRAEIAGDLSLSAGTLSKRVSFEELVPIVQQLKAENRKVVFTNGCFDLLHVGHVTYLQQAAEMGDALVVAINSDNTVRQLKGATRPIIGQEDRSRMLAALSCVDYVVVFEEDTPHRLLRALRPDVLVKGGTYTVDQVVGKEVVQAYGGTVAVTGEVSGKSTTQIVSSLQRVSIDVEPHAQSRLHSTPLNSRIPSTGGES